MKITYPSDGIFDFYVANRMVKGRSDMIAYLSLKLIKYL